MTVFPINKKSWFQIIQENMDELISDDEFNDLSSQYIHMKPMSKEMLYYRKIFEQHFGSKNLDHVIPHYWLPKWCGNITEPSARVLDVYNSE